MTLTKNHFIAIAQILKDEYLLLNYVKNENLKQSRKQMLFSIISSLSIYFKNENPLFNRNTFESFILD